MEFRNNKVDNDVTVVYFGNMLPKERVCCTVSDLFNFNITDTCQENAGNLKAIIENAWINQTSTNKTIFNATKFRLNSYSISDNNCLNLDIGLTDYKDFIGTNNNPIYINFVQCSNRNIQKFLSNPLGVGALVLTSDMYTFLIRRSSTCAEEPDKWDRPGGHPEPQALFGALTVSDIDLSSTDAVLVRDEIISSALVEVRDEVNLPLTACSVPQLMGLSLNSKTCGRPSLEFLIKCDLTMAKVEELYREGSQVEAAESTNIHFIHERDIVQIVCNRNDPLWNSLTPCAKAALYLYCNYNSSKQH